MDHLLGRSCALGAALLWAFALVLFKRSGETVPPLSLNLFKNTVGLVLLALTLIVTGEGFEPLSGRSAADILVLLGSGLIGIAIADTLLFHSLNLMGVGRIAIVECLYSPFVILLSWFMLAEDLTLFHFLGGAMVVGGVLLASDPGADRLRPTRSQTPHPDTAVTPTGIADLPAGMTELQSSAAELPVSQAELQVCTVKAQAHAIALPTSRRTARWPASSRTPRRTVDRQPIASDPDAGESRRRAVAGVLVGALALLLMAFGIVWAKPVLHGFPLIWATALRLLAGTVSLAAYMAVLPQRRALFSVFRPSTSWKAVLPGSLIGGYVCLVLWIAGFKYTDASVAAILNQTSTVFALLLATLVLKESFTRRKLLAVTLAMAGVALVMFEAFRQDQIP